MLKMRTGFVQAKMFKVDADFGSPEGDTRRSNQRGFSLFGLCKSLVGHAATGAPQLEEVWPDLSAVIHVG